MADAHVSMGVVLLAQTVVGFVGNLSLLSNYLFLSCIGNRMRATDFILRHLIVGNFLSLLYRVVREVSIGSTCFQSIFLAISISQGDSKWAGLKGSAHKHIVSTVYFSWGVFLLVSIVFLMFMTRPKAHDSMRSLKAYGYCSSVHHDPAADVLYLAMLSVHDALCLGLMLWAGTSTLLALYRHKQTMQHIQRISVSTRASLESRATISILLLVSAFVFFYSASCIFWICLFLIYNPSSVFYHMGVFVMGCFPAFSPFLLMSGHSTSCSLLFTCTKRKKVVLP
ncbi:PREDICTED: vomeronasal type-1 receptor 4-like [Dipodomys ordii]|uniref:Vomeronasal type-1 receptor n=1 Tax=Dipodomys ordii TaxID=10020 RepID=A0A1S3G339_DIPOR|nr:PREDICTED: vomeronasal type-1 receptor 4-like [Dipodomys ordii]